MECFMSKNLMPQMQDTTGDTVLSLETLPHVFQGVTTPWLPSSNQYPPISTSLSMPDSDNHQMHGFKARWMNFTQYKQELLVLHTPKNVSLKEANLGMLLESGREEGWPYEFVSPIFTNFSRKTAGLHVLYSHVFRAKGIEKKGKTSGNYVYHDKHKHTGRHNEHFSSS